MARKTRREKQQAVVSEEAYMDMTPMIDVVFLLIIFFLCIDFKILEAKLPAYLPKDKGSQSEDTEPQEQLRIKIVCDVVGTRELRPRAEVAFRLVGHLIHYEVGPKRIDNLADLEDELLDIKADDTRRVPDLKNPGQTKLMDVVVEPGIDAVYADVAPCVDTILSVGFDNINFGGGLGSSSTGGK